MRLAVSAREKRTPRRGADALRQDGAPDAVLGPVLLRRAPRLLRLRIAYSRGDAGGARETRGRRAPAEKRSGRHAAGEGDPHVQVLPAHRQLRLDVHRHIRLFPNGCLPAALGGVALKELFGAERLGGGRRLRLGGRGAAEAQLVGAADGPPEVGRRADLRARHELFVARGRAGGRCVRSHSPREADAGASAQPLQLQASGGAGATPNARGGGAGC